MKEWYLENYTPNSCSGFESEEMRNYAEPNFADVLYTDYADAVMLCNSDLSECKEVKCVIQGNTADTQLKSMERIALFPIGTVKAGMYIKFENQYWLITGYPGNNKSYEKVVIQLCQYQLRWQNNNGDIIERYANITSAAKYDVGEGGNSLIFLTSNSFTILLPCDNNTLEVTEKRMFIDKNKKNPEKVFKITRSDDVLYDYGEHGCILSFIASKTELNRLTDNQELGICDYFDPAFTQEPTQPDNEMPILSATISGGTTLRCGRAKSWAVSFVDENDGAVTDCDYKWNLSETDLDILKIVSDNKITLKTMDSSLIGRSFLLQIIVQESVISELKIRIIEGV